MEVVGASFGASRERGSDWLSVDETVCEFRGKCGGSLGDDADASAERNLRLRRRIIFKLLQVDSKAVETAGGGAWAGRRRVDACEESALRVGGDAGAERQATAVRADESVRGSAADAVAGEGDGAGEYVDLLFVARGDGDIGLGRLL